MAITRVNSATGSDTSGTSATTVAIAATSLTTGNLIVVGIRWNSPGGESIISVSDTASNGYIAGPITENIDLDVVQIYYAANVTGNGSNVVTVNFSGIVPYRAANSIQYSGCAVSSPGDAQADGISHANVTVTSSSFTTTVADEVIVAAATISTLGDTWTAGSGYTDVIEDSGASLMMEEKIVSSIQTGVTATADSGTTTDKAIVVMTFKIQAGGTRAPYFYRQVAGMGGH